jgi:hypothetical protein
MLKLCRIWPLVVTQVLAGGGTLRAADAPEWLLNAARAELPAFDAKVPAVVLVGDVRTEIDQKGDYTTSFRYAVKILSREGHHYAQARVGYETDLDKIRDLNAWLVRSSGPVKRFGKSDTLDVAVRENDVYNEERARVMSGSTEAQPGDVFGFESVVESRSLFGQASCSFQGALPVRKSRCEIILPPGWRLKGTMINSSPLTPEVNGQSYVWELRDLPFFDDEPAAPPVTSLAPELLINFAAPEGTKVAPPAFETWQEVSRWASSISDPRAQPNEALAAKARELTQGLSDDIQRIRAIGRFAQKIPYISIQIGLGRFQPHAASEVLAKSYGDCKDKANLMHALLSTLGIPSFPVLVYYGDRDHVKREWPSPALFNHVIIAVQTRAASGLPAALQHPSLGPLLLFDPTDEYTLLGDLPQGDQGGAALLAAGDSGMLFSMPTIPADLNRLVRETSATLTSSGGLTARIVEQSIGQAAARQRGLWQGLPRTDYQRVIETWLATGISGVKTSRVEASDDETGHFRREIDLTSERYGQLMAGRLLIFKPALVSRQESLFLTDPKRKLPVVLNARAYAETAHIKLPAGFAVDELPSPVKLALPFGSYDMQIEAQGDEIVFTRRLTTEAVTIPAEQYAAVRGFFEKIMAAEQAPVVLARR